MDPHQFDIDNSATILVVDDEEMNRELLACNLEDDYAVVTAQSGAEALRLCHEASPDLVLLDVQMGDVSGLDVCRSMQEDKDLREIPVIFITGLTKTSDEDACWEAGGVDFIQKPIHYNTLLHRVKSHLKLKRQAEVLRQMAFKDGLTQIYNRRYLEEHLPRVFKQHQREKAPLSILMIDIDHFKTYNDSYGHIAGDKALYLVAKILEKGTSRPRDLTIRYGGEEFIAILPVTDQHGAEEVALRLNQQVRNENIVFDGVPEGRITISIGIATADGPELYNDELLNRADRALYRAKNNGRNQFFSASDLPAEEP